MGGQPSPSPPPVFSAPPPPRSLRAEPGGCTGRVPMARSRSPHSPTALMRKPRGGRSARRHQASRSTCRLAGGACTSSTPRRSQPWKANREAARASREFQKQRALARRKARNTACPPGSSATPAALGVSNLLSTSASDPGASCTGRAMLRGRPPQPSASAGAVGARHWRPGRRTLGWSDRLTALGAGCPGNRTPGGGVSCAPRVGGGAGRSALGRDLRPWGWPALLPSRRPIRVSKRPVTWALPHPSPGSALPAPGGSLHFPALQQPGALLAPGARPGAFPSPRGALQPPENRAASIAALAHGQGSPKRRRLGWPPSPWLCSRSR